MLETTRAVVTRETCHVSGAYIIAAPPLTLSRLRHYRHRFARANTLSAYFKEIHILSHYLHWRRRVALMALLSSSGYPCSFDVGLFFEPYLCFDSRNMPGSRVRERRCSKVAESSARHAVHADRLTYRRHRYCRARRDERAPDINMMRALPDAICRRRANMFNRRSNMSRREARRKDARERAQEMA